MKAKIKESWSLLKESASEWNKDSAARLGAALSYYTVFSLAPLLIIAIAIGGLVFGADAIRGELSGQLTALFGESAANAIQEILKNAHRPTTGIIATITGVVALILGAVGVFIELKDDLNKIWKVESKKSSSGILGFLKDRLLSFAMVAAIGFLLLVSLLVNTALSVISKYFSGITPVAPVILQILYSLVSFGLVAVLFALIFKVLPDVKLKWRDVAVGALMTSALFTIGKFLIGLYLGKSTVASSFGASAALALILAWAYYSSQILFFGAEFTKVYSSRHGSKRKKTEGAEAPSPALHKAG